jgi:predicted nucleic acid-binding Zn ribbon protein
VSRRSTPKPLADSVRALRAEAQPQTPLAAIQAAWPEAVGARIAAEARPVRERDGTVTVECRAATWAQELDLLHDELLGRLNEALGSGRVTRLRMLVGSNSPSAHFSS